ncbi:MAG: alcohol dehydrogenase [Cyclobacteriaceae bacterium]|nr:MAG: alcohol dehydrogenase [Cyclobacteriaceae bacterium]
MNYIVCEEPGQFLLRQKDAPERKPNEALLEIKKVGICGTDLHAYAGNQAFFTYPRILGHELAAKIIDIDYHPSLKAGDNAVVMPYISCGKCIACRQHKTNCCSHLEVLGVHKDGGMQEQLTVSTDLLIPAHNLTYEEMAIVEPLSIGAHAIRRAGVIPGEFVAVVGCGPIGLGIIKLAQIAGAKVIALDVNDQRLQYAAESLGTEYTVKVTDDALSDIRKITNDDLATVVFDATGHQQALESGHQYMSHGGRYVLVGLSKDNLSFSHPAIHSKEATLMCSRNATREDFDEVISVMRKKLFPSKSFITHMVPFNQMIDHFDSWVDPKTGVIKAIVEF